MTNGIVTAALVMALQGAESQNGDASCHGDQGRSHGVMQIQRAVIHDVNAVYGTQFTLQDSHQPLKARQVCVLYLQYWGLRYKATTGRTPTPEVLARIWNGGPHGYKRNATRKYWSCRVQPRLRALQAPSA
jgi:hypothetical protein